MTKTILFAAGLALTTLSLAASPAAAQAPAGYVPPPVATLDMAYIFRYYNRYKATDEGLKAEVTNAEQQFMQEQKALQELARRLNDYKQGSPEFKAVEEEVAKKEADLRLRGAIMQKNFGEKKAKNYYDALQEVKNVVRYVAEQRGISLVINFNGDEIDPSNPQSVMRGLNETVVYQHRSVDVTPVVLDLLNSGQAIPGPTPTPNPNVRLP